MPTFRHPDKIDKIRNPSEEQLRDAEKHGIDLKDPMVVAELERLQTEADGDVGSDLYCQQKGTIFPTASFHHFPLKKEKVFFSPAVLCDIKQVDG